LARPSSEFLCGAAISSEFAKFLADFRDFSCRFGEFLPWWIPTRVTRPLRRISRVGYRPQNDRNAKTANRFSLRRKTIVDCLGGRLSGWLIVWVVDCLGG
jgi:hypothetical protein